MLRGWNVGTSRLDIQNLVALAEVRSGSQRPMHGNSQRQSLLSLPSFTIIDLIWPSKIRTSVSVDVSQKPSPMLLFSCTTRILTSALGDKIHESHTP